MLDPASVLRILNLTTGKLLTWSSVRGKGYQIFACTNVDGTLIPVSVIPSTGAATMFLDLTATNTQRFYRVSVLP